eukprot:CFRG2844T1
MLRHSLSKSCSLLFPTSQLGSPAVCLTSLALFHSSSTRLMAIKDAKTKKLPPTRYDSKECFIAHARCTFNNTFLTITRENGDAVKSLSCGQVGFEKGKRKQPFAAQHLASEIARQVQEVGISTVRLRFKGIGPGRQTVLKGLMSGGLRVVAIEDITSAPHNGCRKPKARRL